MEWIGCVHCEKSRRDRVARACAIIAPVHTILHRVSCSYEMIPNAPKHYTTHQNMSLGSRLGAFVVKNPDVTSWQELSHELHQFTLLCIEFRVVTKRSQM